MWHPDVTHVAARARGIDRLHHRFLRANTLQYRIGSDSFGQLIDARNTFIASLNHACRTSAETISSLSALKRGGLFSKTFVEQLRSIGLVQPFQEWWVESRGSTIPSIVPAKEKTNQSICGWSARRHLYWG